MWRRVAATVKPRRKPSKAFAPKSATPGVPTLAVARPLTGAEPKPAKPTVAKAAPPPADRGGEKRIRRGKLEIDGSIDLHGHTQETGRTALLRFIQSAHARGDRTLIVITGAGRAGQGVLKQRLPAWLAELKPIIAGYAQAHRQHGGAGAFYVFLKRRG
ncbi:Smr domain family protein [alpha proteobacterium U9-1i]|nr:Smr domain family protein [alpha proteobacterium U9-1i]